MEPLALSDDVFAALHADNIGYIHWKSNQHLDAALAGLTDLDLLVAREDADRFVKLIDDRGFIRMCPPPSRNIPDLIGFLGMDHATGKLVHLDVYCALVLGHHLVKNHVLAVDEWLQSGAVERSGVWTPLPARELVMLYIRTVLRTTTRQLLRGAVRGKSPVPRSMVDEAEWLAERVTDAELAEAVASSRLPVAADELIEFRGRSARREIGPGYLWRCRGPMRRRMRRFERLSRHRSIALKAWMRIRSSRPARKVGLGIPLRTTIGRAPIVAVVGADGSGKTSLSADLVEWLRWKLAARCVYFGQPKTGLVFRGLRKLRGRLLRRARRRENGPLAKLESLVDSSVWMLLASRRRRQAARALVRAGSGETVIAERYPVSDLFMMDVPMDGPRLQSRFGEKPQPLAKAEMRRYQSLSDPDLTIVLQADFDTLRARKSDGPEAEHRAKAEAVQALEPRAHRVFIDATRPYDDVLLDAKRAVWETIRARD